MIQLIYHPDNILVEAIINNKQLYELHLGKPFDPSCPGLLKPNTGYWIFQNQNTNKIYGMVSLTPLSDLMLDVHFYLLPAYWGTGVSLQAAELIINELKDNTPFNILLTVCPESAEHARKFVTTVGFTQSGIFPKALTYFDKQEDLYQYFYNLNG
jgi:RimJ/RimL family protein N-acetyltransferase